MRGFADQHDAFRGEDVRILDGQWKDMAAGCNREFSKDGMRLLLGGESEGIVIEFLQPIDFVRPQHPDNRVNQVL